MTPLSATPLLLCALCCLLVGCAPTAPSPTPDAGNDAGAAAQVDTFTSTPHSIGFLGCSLSINAVNGYNGLGGTLLWPIAGGVTGYPGGSLSVWVSELKAGSQPNSRWAKFASMLATYPNPQAVWWELCPMADVATTTFADTVLVLEEIKRLAPTARVYVTGVPIYPLDGPHCTINTDAGAQATLDLANQLVANGAALKGPTLSPLLTAQTGDGCHANGVGQPIWGQNLLDVFGKGTP